MVDIAASSRSLTWLVGKLGLQSNWFEECESNENIFPCRWSIVSTLLLRVGVRCNNCSLYHGAMSDCLSVLYHIKNSNYIHMLQFELYLINKAPVKKSSIKIFSKEIKTIMIKILPKELTINSRITTNFLNNLKYQPHHP